MAGTNDDEQAGWAEICASFHDIRYGAALSLQREWKECVEETLDRRGSLDRWRALVAEIEKAHGLDGDFTGRHGESGNVARNMRAVLRSAEDPFECPMDLCSRQERARDSRSPKCDLFNKGMRKNSTT
jgi:hypothetical protein